MHASPCVSVPFLVSASICEVADSAAQASICEVADSACGLTLCDCQIHAALIVGSLLIIFFACR
jgi:hypothetical protein